MRKCIILNGPPGVGKDTLAGLLVAMGDFSQCENKTTLHEIALAMTGLAPEVWYERYNNRELKEVPWEELGNMSQRNFFIHLSENVVKPIMGLDQFGRLSARRAAKCPGNVVFSDGGFQPEMGCLQEAFGVENVFLVRLARHGYSFEGDSRNYLQPEGSPFIDLRLHEGGASQAADLIYRYALDKVQRI